MRVRDVLKGKEIQSVITISPTALVSDLVSLMSSHNVGAVLVSTDGVALDGIVSERDVVRRITETSKVVTREVAAIMTTDLHVCEPDEDVTNLMKMMTEHRIRHVPVLDNGKVIGVISIGDVVKSRISELEFERDQLDAYVQQA